MTPIKFLQTLRKARATGMKDLTTMMLCCLQESDFNTMSDLAAFLEISNALVYLHANRLERLGFAVRVPEQLDHRIVYLCITGSGRAALEYLLSDDPEVKPMTLEYAFTAAQNAPGPVDKGYDRFNPLHKKHDDPCAQAAVA